MTTITKIILSKIQKPKNVEICHLENSGLLSAAYFLKRKFPENKKKHKVRIFVRKGERTFYLRGWKFDQELQPGKTSYPDFKISIFHKTHSK